MIKTLSNKMTPNKAKHIAEETLEAVKAMKYKTPSGRTLSLDKLINPAIRRSKLYKPDWVFDDSTLGETIFNGIENVHPGINTSPIITVTKESTLQAGARLADENACFLNFASAKHAGGGFLQGSLAQEESIARSSALYHTLVVHPEFYEENKRSNANGVGFYLDYAIYSPNVPILRNDDGEWLEEPYFMSILTSPAPNKNAILSDLGPAFVEHPDAAMEKKLMDIELKIAVTFRNRMKQVLEIMADNGHRTIVLGSWGSGAFANSPYLVSELFKEALIKCPYFDNVIFAIYDSPDSENLKAYIKCFS